MFRRIFNEKMNVIVLAIASNKFRFHLLADPSEMLAEPIERRRIKHVTPIFGNKHQMHVKYRNAMPASSKVLRTAHRPII